jgi:hypothetical protein
MCLLFVVCRGNLHRRTEIGPVFKPTIAAASAPFEIAGDQQRNSGSILEIANLALNVFPLFDSEHDATRLDVREKPVDLTSGRFPGNFTEKLSDLLQKIHFPEGTPDPFDIVIIEKKWIHFQIDHERTSMGIRHNEPGNLLIPRRETSF